MKENIVSNFKNKNIKLIEALASAYKNTDNQNNVLNAYQQLNATDIEYKDDISFLEKTFTVNKSNENNIAVSFKNQSYSYKALDQISNQIADLLLNNHVKKNQMVGVFVDRGIEFIAAVFGILKAGATYVPIDPSYPEERIQSIVSQCQFDCVISENALLPALITLENEDLKKIICVDENIASLAGYTDHLKRLVIFDSKDIEQASSKQKPFINDADDIAYVIFTSGSTGVPKGVKVSFQNINNLILITGPFELGQHSRVLQFAPLCFDISVGEIFPVLSAGGQVHILPAEKRQSPQMFIDTVAELGITFITTTPSYFHQIIELAQDNKEKLSSIETVVLGGEPMMLSQIKRWREIFGDNNKLYNVYGPTETTVLSSYYLVNEEVDASKEVVVLGKPISNTQIYIVDEDDNVCAIDQVGELLIGGDGVTLGYLNDSERTKQAYLSFPEGSALKQRFYRSGDMARLLADGNIEFVARKDTQVKIRGFRVELGEIETTLSKLSSVKQAVVIDHEKNGIKLLAAYVVTEGDQLLDRTKLFEELASKLPDYMIPASFTQLKQIPLTLNSKLDRRALPKPELISEEPYVAPRNETEAMLCNIWESVLGIEKVGIYDNFYRIGGNSIAAVRLTAESRKNLQIDIPLALIFEFKTIARITEQLDQYETVDIKKSASSNKALSFAQERLLFIEQFEGGTDAYHIPLFVKLTSNYNITKLKLALDQIIARHSTLNMVYQIDEQGNSYIETLNCSVLFKMHIEADLSSCLKSVSKQIKQPFDLANEHSIKLTHYSVGSENYLLMLFHHIAFDGWSTDIFLRELSHAYDCLCSNKPIELPNLEIEYHDFSCWQKEYLQGEKLKQLTDFWENQLAGYQSLQLPLDHPRPLHFDYRGENFSFELDKELSQRLRTMAKSHETTLYTVLLSAFYVTLSSITDQSDIVVGTASDNRQHAQTQSLIGFFVNTLVLRNKVDSTLSLDDFIRKTHALVSQAMLHQELPFEHLMNVLNVERNTSRHPIFQVMFLVQSFGNEFSSYQKLPFKSLNTNGEQSAYSLDDIYSPAKFDMTVILSDASENIKGVINYAVSLFDEQTIKELEQTYLLVLNAFVNDVSQPIEAIDKLTPEIRTKTAESFQCLNDTDKPFDTQDTVVEKIRQVSQLFGRNIAVAYKNASYSYAALETVSNQIGHLLRHYSIRPNDKVGVFLERGVEFIPAILGVLKSGGAYVPIDNSHPAERIKLMATQCNLKVMITERALLPALKAMNITSVMVIICVDELDKCEKEQLNQSSQETIIESSLMINDKVDILLQSKAPVAFKSNADDIAYVIFTSGSTGTPKGVQVTHQNLCNMTLICEQFNWDASYSVLQFAPLCFDVSVGEIFPILTVGGQIRILPAESRHSPQLFIDAVAKYDINIISMTPSYFYQLNEIAKVNKDKLSSIKSVVLGGEAVLQSQANKWINVFGNKNILVNAYGPTETTVLASAYVVEPVVDNVSEMVVMGKPIFNTKIYIIDEQQRLCPIEKSGEIIIAGHGVTKGYLNDQAKTDGVFIDNNNENIPVKRYYKTGDLGRLLPNGNIEFMGRKDNQVKIRGFRVELGEIESVLSELPDIKQSAVVSHEKEGSLYLAAYVVMQANPKFDTEELREALSHKLPHYMVPSTFTLIDEIPLTLNGKLDYKALPDPDFLSSKVYVAPSTSIEKSLVTIWADILQLNANEIGIYDDFFHLGGHSLLAVKLVAEIKNNLQRALAVKDVFMMSTIYDLSQHILSSEEVPLFNANTTPIKASVRSDNEAVPTSFGQERIWFTDQLQQGSAEYNMSAAFRIAGEFDVGVAELAINKIIERHSILRTNYQAYDEGAVQLIRTDFSFKFKIIDLQELAKTHQEEQIAFLIAQERLNTFNLSKDLMIRGTLIRSGTKEKQLNDNDVLLLSMHHIASDGWSMSIFLKEFQLYYDAIIQNEVSLIEPLNIEYADYAYWQRASIVAEERDKLVNYWLEKLAGAPVTHALPLDFSRPKTKEHKGAIVKGSIDAEITQKLLNVANKNHMSIFMLLHAGLALALSRHSNSQDIIIGTPVANRHQPELESLIGFFVNTLVLRANTDFESLSEYLSHIRTVHFEAHENQSLPFEQLVEHCNIPRSLSHSPLFQILFTMHVEQADEIDIHNGRINKLPESEFVAKFDLDISSEIKNGCIVFSWIYDTKLFSHNHIETLCNHVCRLLSNVAQDHNAKLCDIGMLSTQERMFFEQQLAGNKIDFSQDTLFHEYFEKAAIRHPDKIAVIFESLDAGSRQLTYRELNQSSNQLARYLRGRGVKVESRVGICVERSPEMVIAILAILKAGGVYAPLDAGLPTSRLQYMCLDLDLKILLTQKPLRSRFTFANELEFVELDDESFYHQLTNYAGTNLTLLPGQKMSDAAYVIYTSGSTGKPKGVVIEHGNLCNYVLGLQEKFTIPYELNYGVITSISTDLGNTTLLSGLAFSGTLHIFSEEQITDSAYISQYINIHQLDILKLTPSHFSALFLDEQLAQFSCRWLFIGGEAIDANTKVKIEKLIKLGTNVINHYGPTETTIGCCATQLTTEMLTGSIPVGKPLPNVYSYLISPDGQLAPFGSIGELLIGGEGVARGYLNQPEQTTNRFIDDPFNLCEHGRVYRTGDLMRYQKGGNLVFEGRTDDQIKIRGYRVEIGEIENAIVTCEGVNKAIVVAHDKDGLKVLMAYLIGNKEANNLIVSCQQRLSEFLPEYMIPSAFMVIENIPLMPNGKVDKKSLPLPETTAIEECVKAQTDTEKVLVKIWAKLFKLEENKISTSANFFELGGHSLLSIRFISEVRKQFQHIFSIQDVFDLQTLTALAADIDANVTSQTNTEAVKNSVMPVTRKEGEAVITSYSQQRLWFMHQLNSGSAEYNMPAAFKITGTFELTAAEQAIERVIACHESLRTTYHASASNANEALQTIQTDYSFSINQLDFSELKASEQQDRVNKLIAEDSLKSFDISNDLMVRVSYIKLSCDNQHNQDVLMFNMHHIASDGWSMGIFLKEFIANYTAIVEGQQVELEPLEIQYADYAFWQRQPHFTETVNQQLGYWKKQLLGAPAVHSLELDFPRPEIKQYRGSTVNFHLNQETTNKLKQLATDNQMTLFMLLHAGLSLLLSRHSNSQDIVIGTPVANRRQVELETLIGFFVNTLVLRSNTNYDNIEEYLAHIREINLDAQANQDIPFEQLVEHCNVMRTTNHSPLFQIMFSMNTNEQTQLAVPGVQFDQLMSEDTVAKFDIDISAQETSQGIELSWRYDTSIFTHQHIQNMGQHLVSLFDEIIVPSKKRLNELVVLSDEEIKLFNGKFNNTSRYFPQDKSLHELFEAQVIAQPDNIAVHFDGSMAGDGEESIVEELTYRQLNEAANKLAHHLRRQGVTCNALVGLYMERSSEMVIAILAILKAGGAYVPLDPSYPKARLNYILESSGMAHLITTENVKNKELSVENIDVINMNSADYINDVSLQPMSNPKRLDDQDLENLAYVIFTSGSTGQPKGVMMQHLGVVNRIDWMQNTYQLNSSDRVLQKTPYFFDVSVWEFLWTLGYGATLVVAKPEGHKDAHYLNELMQNQNITMLHFVPSMLKAFLAVSTNQFGRDVRHVFCSGESLGIEEVREMQNRADHVQLHNLYGPTEAAIDVSYFPCEALANERSVPIGKPIQNIQLMVLDEQLNHCPLGVPGELCISGVGLAKGYLNEPELTEKVFIRHPFSENPKDKIYKTGDLVRWLPDGNLAYIARIDHQVKLRGLRVELGEIEYALVKEKEINKAVVVARNSTLGEQQLVAYLVHTDASLLSDTGDDTAELRAKYIDVIKQALKLSLPDYMVPSAFVFLAELPLTPTGKIDRKALPEPDLSNLQRKYQAPSSEVEIALCTIWQDILDIDSIGVNDNFFELGGHSLLANSLVMEINKEFNVSLELMTIFKAQSVAEIANKIEELNLLKAMQKSNETSASEDELELTI